MVPEFLSTKGRDDLAKRRRVVTLRMTLDDPDCGEFPGLRRVGVRFRFPRFSGRRPSFPRVDSGVGVFFPEGSGVPWAFSRGSRFRWGVRSLGQW